MSKRKNKYTDNLKADNATGKGGGKSESKGRGKGKRKGMKFSKRGFSRPRSTPLKTI